MSHLKFSEQLSGTKHYKVKKALKEDESKDHTIWLMNNIFSLARVVLSVCRQCFV